jgi:hypothetical protein
MGQSIAFPESTSHFEEGMLNNNLPGDCHGSDSSATVLSKSLFIHRAISEDIKG